MDREKLCEQLTVAADRLEEAFAPDFVGSLYLREAAALITALAAENERMHGQIEEAKRVIAFGCVRLINGRPINPLKNGEQCDHGRQEWEDCIGCYDEALLAALEGER